MHLHVVSVLAYNATIKYEHTHTHTHIYIYYVGLYIYLCFSIFYYAAY